MRAKPTTLQVAPPSFIDIQGRKLAFDEIAPAQPKGTILFLTGLASKRLGWRRQMDFFGAGYRCIAVDFRGTGDSDPVADPYGIADVADDAAAVLRARGVDRAHVIGISMGGFVAQEVALRHPELVRKLVLTSTAAGGRVYIPPTRRFLLNYLLATLRANEIGNRAKLVYAQTMAPGYCKAHPDVWNVIADVARYRPQTPQSLKLQTAACRYHNTVDRLSQIQVPTLVIHGTADPLIPVGNGKYLAAHIPGARLILYSGVGHIPIAEREADYNRDVAAFLAE